MSLLAGPSRPTATSPSGVTYRHILSSSALTVFNPLRTIAHIDVDAAYAQFESVRLGISPTVPLICAQWQSIIAVNYPARAFGIKRFNTIDEARKACPHLVVQHVATYRDGEAEAGYWGEGADPRTHKVSLDPYRRESLKILAVFKEMIPKGEIEKASIDEAFIDLTPMAIDRLLSCHPHLRSVPEDAPDGLDSPLPEPPPIDWARAGNVIPIARRSSRSVHDAAATHEDEADADGTNVQSTRAAAEQTSPSRSSSPSPPHSDTWEDWALLAGAEIVADVRKAVFDKLQYTCSAGIAHSKAMAKLCSAWKKPNKQTVLRSAATPGFLRDMDFTDIRMLGGKLGTSIATEFNAKTVGDLLDTSLEDMQKRFGEESIWVYNIIRGIDHSEVTSRVSTKSMLASKNTRPPVTTPSQGLHWLKILSGELAVRLRESREIAPGLWPKTLVLGHRTGIEPGKHRQIPFPFTRNLSAEYILKYATRLWEEVCQPMSRGGMKLNNMSLSFTGLERMEEGQKGIEGFFGAAAPKPAGSSNFRTSPKLAASPSPKRKRSAEPMQGPGAESMSATDSSTAVTVTAPATAASIPSHAPTSAAATAVPRTRLPTLHTGKKRTGLEAFLAGGSGSTSKPTARNTPPRNARLREAETAATSSSVAQADGDPLKPQLDETPDSRHTGPVEVIDVDIEEAADVGTATVEPETRKAKARQGGETWTCPECGLQLDTEAQIPDIPSAPDVSDATPAPLTAAIQEHQDYHFALQLQKNGSSPVSGGRGRGAGTEPNGRNGTNSTQVKAKTSVGGRASLGVGREGQGEDGGPSKGKKRAKTGESGRGSIKAFFAPK